MLRSGETIPLSVPFFGKLSFKNQDPYISQHHPAPEYPQGQFLLAELIRLTDHAFVDSGVRIQLDCTGQRTSTGFRCIQELRIIKGSI
jgi:hypothetical protein